MSDEKEEYIKKGFSEILNKENFKKHKFVYFLLISFFIFLLLQIIIGGFEVVLIVYLFILIMYSIFKVMK